MAFFFSLKLKFFSDATKVINAINGADGSTIRNFFQDTLGLSKLFSPLVVSRKFNRAAHRLEGFSFVNDNNVELCKEERLKSLRKMKTDMQASICKMVVDKVHQMAND